MADEPVLNEWHTETREIETTVPDITLDEQGRVKSVQMVQETREVSEKVMYTRPVAQKACARTEHEFDLVPIRQAGRLIEKCRQCQHGRLFVFKPNSENRSKGGE